MSLRAVSSAVPSLMRMPSSAALPVPTMTAVGVARPRAQGQAMMRTATVVPMASTSRSVLGPNVIQPMKVARAASRTAGTNQAETWSASRCIGAWEPWASSTRRMIWARVLSAPTASARTTRVPVRFAVAPMTWSPGRLSTGDGLAGEHRLVDRGRAVDDGAVDGDVLAGPDADEVADGYLVEGHVDLDGAVGPSRRTRAVVGARPTRVLMEAAVRFLALSSSQRPIRTRATTMSAVSK